MTKKNFLFVCLLSLALGCSDDDPTHVARQNVADQLIYAENDRLVFKDFDAFNSTITELNKKDSDALKKWKEQFRFHSMGQLLESAEDSDESELSSDMEDYSKFPLSYLHVLNSKGEVKIGEDIIWYNNGAKYAAQNENDLIKIKLNPAASPERGKYTIDASVVKNNAGDQQRLELGHGQGYSGTHGLVFNFDYNNGVKRYLHEIISFADFEFYEGGGFIYRTTLYFRFRLQYKSSGKWYAEKKDTRLINWDISTDIESWDIRGNVTHQVRDFKGKFLNVKGDQRLLLLDDLKWGRSGEIGWFYITLTGKVNDSLLYPVGPTTVYSNLWEDFWDI